MLTALAKETNAWACYDCGKCTATCPVSRAGSPFSPRKHILATNTGRAEQIVHDKTLFTCLTCRQCDDRCPAEVDYTTLVQRLREQAFEQKVEPECPHGGALQSVMRMMAEGGTTQDRLKWLTPDLETNPSTGKVFFWTGCTMYYDAFFPEFEMRALEGTKAGIRILNALGETPVVSPEERCCGHDLLWNGDKKGFEALAKLNTALVKKSGAETVVTPCAECARTWKKDYAPFIEGKAPKVLHLTEFLADNQDKLKLKKNGTKKVTYQDPCRLGRHLGIYDQPRDALTNVPGVEIAEMGRTRKGAVCCAGSTWSNCDRFAKKIQMDRLRDARATGAEVLVTACPKCQIHYRCAMKDPKLGDELRIEMRDVGEIVADALDS